MSEQYDAAVPPPPPPPPRWGLADALWGWGAAVLLGGIVGALIVGVAGYLSVDQSAWPLWLIAVAGQIPLWGGLLGAPLVAARRNGGTLVSDFGLRFRWTDVPLGLLIGLAAQFVLVPLVSWPWLRLWGKSPDDLSKTATDLVDKANDPFGVVLLILIVVIGAPFVEEIFYRGLLLRSLQRLMPVWAAVVLCGLIFGISHFQLLGLPALAAFGMVLAVLAVKTGRLGLSIMAHLGFNAVTVWALLSR